VRVRLPLPPRGRGAGWWPRLAVALAGEVAPKFWLLSSSMSIYATLGYRGGTAHITGHARGAGPDTAGGEPASSVRPPT